MAANSISNLQRHGMTNAGSEDYGTIASGHRRLVATAYCTSEPCCAYRTVAKRKQKDGSYVMREAVSHYSQVKKAASRSQERCADCGSYLLWRSE